MSDFFKAFEKKNDPNTEGGEEEGDENPEAQEVKGDQKLVDMPTVERKTGEEDEHITQVQRSKLYRFRDGEWKERGLGHAKLLRHKDTKQFRFLMRQEQTKKIVGNFYISSEENLCNLKPMSNSDKAWTWTCVDFSEESMSTDILALKFGTKDLADAFKEKFYHAKEWNGKLKEGKELGEPIPVINDVDALADDLQKTKIEEKKE